MSATTKPTTTTAADVIVRRLKEHGVRHIFGYPGGQITPLYDALQRDGGIRHILARDEQAAGFMADGYARVSGAVGVAMAVCGPGVYNAFTPLATAFTDSIPILLLSGQVATAGRGLRSGYYHENEQLRASETLTKWRGRVESFQSSVPQLDQAFHALTNDRPGPALLEIPVDILRADVNHFTFPALPEGMTLPVPRLPEIKSVAELICTWQKPLIIAGGGIVTAGAENLLARVAERLGAPVITTLMGKCAIPSDHPLASGLAWRRATSDLSNMESCMSPLFDMTDGWLAIGCRFTQASTGSWSMRKPDALVQVDIDPEEIGRHYPVTMGVQADAREFLRVLLNALPSASRTRWAMSPTRGDPWTLGGMDLLTALRKATPPDTVFAADITRLGYMMLAEFPINRRRCMLHPAGFVPMGYGIPAAIGAKAAVPERTVVAVVGDGCFQMSGFELATATQENLPIVVVVVNDGSLSLIKAIQERRYQSRFLGVDIANPDFELFGKAFGVRFWRADSTNSFETAVREAIASGQTSLVEVQVKE